ncbi:F-box/LRR-repeat protein [Carex littledalei]|uniref:F-box/LRR-repeat protein n=1 Tax=Carex littledalei TaxID=544730 RepID=A0A833RL92_9POAL|nr:F-box/LRR-repeat protein [Carex littledalei]
MACSSASRVDLDLTNRCTQTDTAGVSPDMRQWENLTHDILVCILSKLQLHDLINGGSRVCSSWRAASMEPVCWCHILGVDRPKLLRDIADCGNLTEFWHFLCGLYGGFSREHSEMVDFIIRKKI